MSALDHWTDNLYSCLHSKGPHYPSPAPRPRFPNPRTSDLSPGTHWRQALVKNLLDDLNKGVFGRRVVRVELDGGLSAILLYETSRTMLVSSIDTLDEMVRAVHGKVVYVPSLACTSFAIGQLTSSLFSNLPLEPQETIDENIEESMEPLTNLSAEAMSTAVSLTHIEDLEESICLSCSSPSILPESVSQLCMDIEVEQLVEDDLDESICESILTSEDSFAEESLCLSILTSSSSLSPSCFDPPSFSSSSRSTASRASVSQEPATPEQNRCIPIPFASKAFNSNIHSRIEFTFGKAAFLGPISMDVHMNEDLMLGSPMEVDDVSLAVNDDHSSLSDDQEGKLLEGRQTSANETLAEISWTSSIIGAGSWIGSFWR